MLLIVPLLAVLSSAVPAAASAPQQSFSQIKQQADSARSADQLKEAIGLYREGVRLHPGWDEGWWWLGNLYYEQDRFPEAKAAFTRFAAIAPKPGQAWAFLALCEYETHDYDRAAEHFQRWVKAGVPGSSGLIEVATFHWALLLTRGGDFGQALRLLLGRAQNKNESPILVEALGLASLRLPNLPEDYPPQLRERVWLAGKAEFYAITHDFARAQEYSHRLLAGYGQEPNVHYLQGTLLKVQQRTGDAAQEFRKELQISPQHVPAMVELAQIEVDTGNSNEAMSLARHAVQIEPANQYAHHLLGQALLAAGQTKESAQELESAERLAPDDAAIRFHLAEAYRALGRQEDALREMSAYVSIRKKEGTLAQTPEKRDAEGPK